MDYTWRNHASITPDGYNSPRPRPGYSGIRHYPPSPPYMSGGSIPRTAWANPTLYYQPRQPRRNPMIDEAQYQAWMLEDLGSLRSPHSNNSPNNSDADTQTQRRRSHRDSSAKRRTSSYRSRSPDRGRDQDREYTRIMDNMNTGDYENDEFLRLAQSDLRRKHSRRSSSRRRAHSRGRRDMEEHDMEGVHIPQARQGGIVNMKGETTAERIDRLRGEQNRRIQNRRSPDEERKDERKERRRSSTPGPGINRERSKVGRQVRFEDVQERDY